MSAESNEKNPPRDNFRKFNRERERDEGNHRAGRKTRHTRRVQRYTQRYRVVKKEHREGLRGSKFSYTAVPGSGFSFNFDMSGRSGC